MKHTSYLTTLCITMGLALSVLYACDSSKKEKPDEIVQKLLPDKAAEVRVMPLTKTDFKHELVSNGRISARTIAEINFKTADVITEIVVRNGDRVVKGQRIAILNTFALKNKLKQAKDALEQSKLELQDVLIGQGYHISHFDEVPDDVMQLAKVKSHFNTAQTNSDMARYELEKATLTAPISGTIANLFAKSQTMSNPSKPFCSIIDMHSFEVSFNVLENELGFIKKGDNVTIVPFSMANLEIKGRVIEINPWVDENGMVRVKASVDYHARLVEGMNVRVSAFRSAGKQWVVPKTAVVLRTGKQVIFTAVDGKAIWCYVTTGLENATSFTITSKALKDGDQIIVSGNTNLAHESPIKIIEE